ncbi:MAG: extracellular solute-binding protein [Clostridia bacterium]
MKKTLAFVLLVCILASSTALAQVEYRDRDHWPIVDAPVTIRVMGPKAAHHVEWAEMDLWKWLSEKTGLQFEFNTPAASSFAERKSLAFSANDLPDLFMSAGITPAEVVKYGVQQGQLVKLDDYFDYAPNIAKAYADYPDTHASQLAEDGFTYTVGLINIPTYTASGTHLFINNKWLTAANVGVPTTIDAFYEMLKAFKAAGDINGNGKADEIPLGASKDFATIRCCLLESFGYTSNAFELDRATGKVVYPPITDGYKEYLQYMNRFWDEGLLDVDMFSQDHATFKAKAQESQYGVFAGLASFLVAPADQILDWDMVTPLTSERNAEPLQRYASSISGGIAAITSVNKNIEATMMLLDWMYTKEGVMSVSYGPNNWEITEEGAHAFILKDGTHGADDAYRGTLTFAPGASIPVNVRASADTYAQYYKDTKNNYNNAILYAQFSEHALPYAFVSQPSVIWTSEEAEAIVDVTEMKNYVEQMEGKFITGELDIDKEWDNYVSTIKGMNYENVYNAYASAWARYNENIK